MITKFFKLFLTLALIFFILFFSFMTEESFLDEKDFFDRDFLKNTRINLYCGFNVVDGFFETNNLQEFCKNKDLPDTDFSFLINNVLIIDNYGIIEATEKIKEKNSNIVLSVQKINHIVDKKIFNEEVLGISENEGFIEVYFENKIKKYQLIDGYFAESMDEKKKLKSLSANVYLEIPTNWDYYFKEKSILFFHKDIPDNYYFELEKDTYNIISQKNASQIAEKVKKTIKEDSLKVLDDYSSFKSGLIDYLEINIPDRKIYYFENKEKKESFNILASGNPVGWEGTPGGLYQVLSKEGLRFSTESSVFMPFSVRIYGKYLMHGEPYYRSGALYQSALSGGCIRVKNEEMKDLYDLAYQGLPVLSLIAKNEKVDYKNNFVEFPVINADSYIVADADSGKVFAEKNYDKIKPIASITKIMTAIIAVEQMGLTMPITIRDYMLTGHGETRGIYANRSVRLIDLLAPLLVESSNNAAMVMAHYLGRDNTLYHMNEKAKNIGMEQTNFSEWSGIEKENTSTAKDIYYLAYYLLNSRNPLLKISKQESVANINYQFFPSLVNKNIFYQDEYFIGGKTGFTYSSGHTGFFIFNIELNQEPRRIIFVVLGSNSHSNLKNDVMNLKKWVEESFNY